MNQKHIKRKGIKRYKPVLHIFLILGKRGNGKWNIAVSNLESENVPRKLHQVKLLNSGYYHIRYLKNQSSICSKYSPFLEGKIRYISTSQKKAPYKTR